MLLGNAGLVLPAVVARVQGDSEAETRRLAAGGSIFLYVDAANVKIVSPPA